MGGGGPGCAPGVMCKKDEVKDGAREISSRACNPDREQCECKAYAKGHGCVEWGYPSNPYIMGRKEENDVAREISSRACNPDREQCECKAYAKGHGCVEWGYPSNPYIMGRKEEN